MTQPVETENTTQLSIQDLHNIRSIIDVASSRGAFRANELSTVGNAYNRLDAFLTSIEAASTSEDKVEEVGETQ